MDAFTLAANLVLDSKEFESSLAQSEGQFKTFGNQLAGNAGSAGQTAAQTFGAKFASGFKMLAGSAVAAKVGKAIYDFASESVEVYAQFDKSMAQVAATMGLTMAEMATQTGSVDTAYGKFSGTLRDFARFMGGNTMYSASQAADALNYMALAGYDAQKSMEMLPNVLNLAAAGGMDLARASDMVTDASSALGLDMRSTVALVDKMAKASQRSNTSVAQLGEAILTVGGTAKDLHGGTTELAVALGILADNGTKGAEGGTALRNILLSLEAPTDKAALRLKKLGVNAFDSMGKLRALPEIFQDLNYSLSSLSDKERTNALNEIFNKVDLKSVNALLGTTAERYAQLTEEVENSEGSAQQMSETQMDNLEGDRKKRDSAKEGAQLALAKFIEPTVRKLTQKETQAWQETEAFFSKLSGNGSFFDKFKSGVDALFGWLSFGPIDFTGSKNAMRAMENALDRSNAAGKNGTNFANRPGSFSFNPLSWLGITNEESEEELRNRILRELALNDSSIPTVLRKKADDTGASKDFSVIIDLLYQNHGEEAVNAQIDKIIAAEAAGPYKMDVDANMTGNAPEGLAQTSSKVTEAKQALERYASYLAMQKFSVDATFNDQVTDQATHVIEKLAELHGVSIQDYMSTSVHIDDATPELEKVRAELQEQYEWDAANGTLRTRSEHDPSGLISGLNEGAASLDSYRKTWGDKEINSSASLDSSGVTDGIDAATTAQEEYKTAYDGATVATVKTGINNPIPGALATTETEMGDFTSVWDNKNLATTSSKHDDGTSGPIEKALKAIGDLRGEDGKTISTTYSKHYHEIITTAAKAYAEETGKSGEAGQIAQLMASQGLTEDEIEEMLRNGGGGTYKPEKYATAMSGGHILHGATMFGLDSTGHPLIGGEAGPEAIVGVNSLQGMIKQSIAEMLGGFPTAQEIADAMTNVHMQVVTDTGALVGAIAGEMDSELSRRTAWRGGGRA